VFGSAWNTRQVSGTVLSIEEEGTSKRSISSVVVQWDLPGGQKTRRVNLRSVSAVDAPGTELLASQRQTAPGGSATVADVQQDDNYRYQGPGAYSEFVLEAPPNEAACLADATTWTAHVVLWEEKNVLEPVGGRHHAVGGCCGLRQARLSTKTESRGQPFRPGAHTTTLWLCFPCSS
jgi:hypothetical protein